MSKSLLIAPVLIAVGMLCMSIGVGLYDFRIGLVVGGVFFVSSGFLLAPVVAKLEERKNGDSGSVPSRRS